MKYRSHIRRRVEAQGYLGLDDEAIARIEPWLRLAPGVTLIWIAVAWFADSALGFFMLVPVAWLGAVLRYHPVEAVYVHWLRKRFRGPALPDTQAPRRFAHALRSVLTMLAGMALFANFLPVAGAITVMLGVVSAVNLATGFCIFSWGYTRVFVRPVENVEPDPRQVFWTNADRPSEPTQPRVFTSSERIWL